MRMIKTWVVVAESSRARIFSLEKMNGPLTEILIFDNPAARKHDLEFHTNRSGQVNDSHGRHDIYEYDETRQQAHKFARKIADLLDSHRLTADYDQLVVFAAPSFLGLLREHMNEQTNKRIVHHSNKNLVQLKVDKIREHIPFPIPKLTA